MKIRSTHRLRALLRSRALLVKTRASLDNHLRGILKSFGRKVGRVAVGLLGDRVLELVEGEGILEQTVRAVLRTRQGVMERIDELHRLVLAATKADPFCRRLMSVPGASAR